MKYKEKDRFSIELFFGKEKGNLLILLSKLKPNNIGNKIIYTYRNKEVLEYEIDSKTLAESNDNTFFKKSKQLYGDNLRGGLLIETFKMITNLDVEKILVTMHININYPENTLKNLTHSITFSRKF